MIGTRARVPCGAAARPHSDLGPRVGCAAAGAITSAAVVILGRNTSQPYRSYMPAASIAWNTSGSE